MARRLSSRKFNSIQLLKVMANLIAALRSIRMPHQHQMMARHMSSLLKKKSLHQKPTLFNSKCVSKLLFLAKIISKILLFFFSPLLASVVYWQISSSRSQDKCNKITWLWDSCQQSDNCCKASATS